MELHWFYKVPSFSPKSPKRGNFVLPMLFHFFWSFWTHPQTLKPGFTKGNPFLLTVFVCFPPRGDKRNGFPLVLQRLSRFGYPPGGQKKWIPNGFYRVPNLSWESCKRQNLFYQCFSIACRRFGRTRKPGNLVLLMEFISF